MVSLRLLEPETDLDLYREAFNWRTHKQHTSAPSMAFETFSSTDPTHLTFGLFNEELIAVYFLREWKPAHYEAHMTSRKNAPRETLLEGARAVLNLLLTNGAEEVGALILPSNRPLRRFVTQLGMARIATMKFLHCADISDGGTIQPRNLRTFVKYIKMKDESPVGPFRPQTNFHADAIGHV